jgi:uncharacterized phage infection (PIP) family protein YhgE
VDEEVGYLTDAVGRLKGMAREINHESERTSEVQRALEGTLLQAQGMMKNGVRQIKTAHKSLTSSCSHMMVLMIYIVAAVLGVVFLSKLRNLLSWIF